MSRFQSFQEMFRRDRRPGDIVFAWAFFLFGLFLLSQLGSEAPWKGAGRILAQPAFWPILSLGLMAAFAALHLLSSALSPRLAGRWREVWNWVRSVEYAIWFMAYVFLVPYAGYLPCSVIFAVLLGLRAGYRSGRTLAGLAVTAIVIVVVFKGFLQVRIPGGAIYQYLPTELRSFMLTYF